MTLEHTAKALDMVRASLDAPKKEHPMTTTNKSTPGPWEAVQCIDFLGQHTETWCINVYDSLTRMPWEVAWLKPNPFIPDIESNARLIAAVPELLEALRAMPVAEVEK